MKNYIDGRARLGLALLSGSLIAVAGCSDTALQGVTLDDDLNTPELVYSLAKGANSEVADAWYVGNEQSYPYVVSTMTDELVSDVNNVYQEVSASDLDERTLSSIHDQGHEASWAAVKVIQRAEDVIDNFDTAPLVARMWTNMGNAELIMARIYCENNYGYGPEGGLTLRGPDPYDNTQLVSRDSTYQRAIFGYLAAIEQAERAIAAGEAAENGDPLFEPEYMINESRVGLAGAYLELASFGIDAAANYQNAVNYASQVPSDFEGEIAIDNTGVGGALNDWWGEHNDDDNSSVWGQVLADGTVWGSPYSYLYGDDPRTNWGECENLTDPDSPPGVENDADNPIVNGPDRSNGAICEFPLGIEGGTIPIWQTDTYAGEEYDANFRHVSGVEARLIEAEVALVNNNLGEFITQVNAARAAQGLGALSPAPTSIGSLEYPNAQDDAWSILDRERFLAFFSEGKRYVDFDRWDHPFYTNNVGQTPREQAFINGNGGRRYQCAPMSGVECNLNPALPCPVLDESNTTG